MAIPNTTSDVESSPTCSMGVSEVRLQPPQLPCLRAKKSQRSTKRRKRARSPSVHEPFPANRGPGQAVETRLEVQMQEFLPTDGLRWSLPARLPESEPACPNDPPSQPGDGAGSICPDGADAPGHTSWANRAARPARSGPDQAKGGVKGASNVRPPRGHWRHRSRTH